MKKKKLFNRNSQILLLDGLPRTVNQTKKLNNIVNVFLIIALQVKEEKVLFKRLKNRAKIEGREDDENANVIESRFEEYRSKTAQILSKYPESIISYINAQQSPLLVFKEILDKNWDKL